MNIVISIILIVNFLFTPVFAFASEVVSTDVDSTGYSPSGFFSLQDALDGNIEAENQLRSIGVTFGQAVDASVRSLVVAPVKAAASSFMSAADDTIDTVVDALIGDTNFMSEIFINPFTKSFEWGPSAGRHGGGLASGFFYDNVSTDAPPGFYPCGYQSTFKMTDNQYYWFLSDFENSYFCFWGSNRFLICTKTNPSSIFSVFMRTSSTVPSSDNDGSIYFQGSSRYNIFTFDDIDYHYVTGGGISLPSSSPYSFYYSSAQSALEAFFSFVPTVDNVSNGKGYVRSINIDITANGNNVYNTDWNKVITNNYNTYGDTFNNTTVNNFYYQVSSPDTPSYWYDIYDNDTVVVPTGDFDLDDITLSSPELTTNNNFLNTLFGAFPVALSGLFLALLMLSAVIIFLRG